jgi:hypothetical protein
MPSDVPRRREEGYSESNSGRESEMRYGKALCTVRPVEVTSWPAPSTVWHAESRGAAASNAINANENTMRMKCSLLPAAFL